MQDDLSDACTGCMLGTAVGDALGLPTERMSRRRTRTWRAGCRGHSFLPGRGMLSDDTEHAFFVAQSLLEEYGWPATPLRNLFFLLVVLLHCLRRLLPPY